MRPEKIISGGQNGVDLTGLKAAKHLGIETGGTAPNGWRVCNLDGSNGTNPELATYGLVESGYRSYPVRTVENIKNSDGTVLFGNVNSSGSKLTTRSADNLEKPLIVNPTPQELRAWVEENKIKVLNVAGNRATEDNAWLMKKVWNCLVKAFG
ncbi:MAG: putative molybdenum carrier protein [Cyanobacteria bacterium P01_D01_bin.36]